MYNIDKSCIVEEINNSRAYIKCMASEEWRTASISGIAGTISASANRTIHFTLKVQCKQHSWVLFAFSSEPAWGYSFVPSRSPGLTSIGNRFIASSRYQWRFLDFSGALNGDSNWWNFFFFFAKWCRVFV